MSAKKEDVVIDSWDDLIARQDVKKIVAINLKTRYVFDHFAKFIYFPEGKYREKLTSRLNLKSVDEILNVAVLDQHLQEVAKGKEALMFHKTSLQYFKRNKYSNLHVSKFGGQSEPYFLLLQGCH